MPDALSVHVNRESLHALEVPDSFETSGGFDVRLVNHGESCHVHLHLDDVLSEVVAIDGSNHHVDGGGELVVRVARTGDGPARGTLKVVTAYGATTRHVDVQVTEPTEPVAVDEELAKPQPRAETTTPSLFEGRQEKTLLAGGVVVLGLALATAAVFQNTLILLAVLVLAVSGLVAALVVDRAG